jgi:hypothetical protein
VLTSLDHDPKKLNHPVTGMYSNINYKPLEIDCGLPTVNESLLSGPA